MGKIPTDPSAGSSRYNPMARPSETRGHSAAAPESAPTPPASAAASSASPHVPAPTPTHERPESGLQSDGLPVATGSAPASREPMGRNRPRESPGFRELRKALHRENSTGAMQSKWNGYKLMSPHVQEAIPQFDNRFPDNINGIVPDNPREFSQVFHDFGMDKLRPGIVTRGEESSVDVPADIRQPTARVMIHSHPYTGEHFSDIPSIDDQLVARRFPRLEHIVQTPAPDPGQANVYQIYSGSIPPRYYTLVPNPGNLPVPPPSPDGHARFHPMPGEGSGSGEDPSV